MRILRNARGQASLMIAVMTLTFLFFFAFVVNTGMLVNAKINLQNAADLAAYAGAAVQARQLNQISFLNYEMRRQYKKFLFRYYVLGNMAQKGFPRNGGGSGPMLWSPTGTSDTDYNVPVVCMIFKELDNYCQVQVLASIKIPPSSPFDSITSTLKNYLEQMEQIRQNNCRNIANVNTMVLRLWLWNTDPELRELIQGVTDPKERQSMELVQALGYGLGLIPREVILQYRIKTLQDFANTPPQTSVDLDKVDALKSKKDQAAFERTIQAFYSAYYTLGNHTFPAGNIKMDEIIPEKVLNLKPITTQFSAYSVDMIINPSTKSCDPVIHPESLARPIPIGFEKDPKYLTYYAVRLQADARVLFNPFGDTITMKAYAAAQPFGSRVGPHLEETDFVRQSATPNIGAKDSSSFLQQIPNLPIKDEGDGTGKGMGWDRQEVLGALFGLFKGSNGELSPQISLDDMDRAYQGAMAPNPYEGRLYNIISDVDKDPYVRYFDNQHVAAFWAPVFPEDKRASMAAILKNDIDELLAAKESGTSTSSEALQAQLLNYLDRLVKGQGENNEGFNVVRITDPFSHRPGPLGSGGFTPINLPSWLVIDAKDPSQYRTSWRPSSEADTGRVGYSVKFVSFDSLGDHKSSPSSAGSEMWTNGISDGEALDDIFHIQH